MFDRIKNIFEKDKFFLGRAHLLNNEPFYAAMAAQCSTEATPKVKTISIREDKGALYIVYNPEWIKSQPVEKIAEAIKHVLNHLIFGHLGNGTFTSDDQRMEIAKDLAINSYLDKNLLPEGFMSPEDYGLKKGKSTLEYYSLLPEMPKQEDGNGDDGEGKGQGQGQGGKGDKPGDDHDFMTSESSESQMDQYVQMMVQQAHERAQGRLPSAYGSEIVGLIKAMLVPSEIPWQVILRRFIAFSAQTKKETTWKKPNRRFGDLQRGNKKKQLLHILIGVDESGSVGDKEWELFWSEIDSIHKTHEVSITVAKFTTKIEKIFEYKKIDDVALTRYSGGTTFQPLFNLAEKEKPDCLICFTDGYNADIGCKYSRPNTVLWGLIPGGQQQEKFGKAINIKNNKLDLERKFY